MRLLLVSLSALFTLSPLHAINVAFTEAMSSSAGATGDWIEITNLDSAPLDITNWKIDDSSSAFANSVTLMGVTNLAPGQSAIFLESNAPVTAIPAFRTFWGSNAASIVIGSYTGSGVGLSSGGDGLALFNDVGTLITQVSFGAATTGSSFGYNPNTQTFSGISVDGQFGAYASTNTPTDIGSPGVIPEPSTWTCIIGTLALIFAIRRRSR